MKNLQKRNPTLLGLLILAALALSACATPAAASQTEPASAPEAQTASENVAIESSAEAESVEAVAEETPAVPVNANGLTNAEVAGLVFMREEEKLAHDVYLTLYDLWGLPLFQNIANSELTHTEAVLNLLNNYDIEDPAAGTALGVFANPDLQALYDELTASGAQSLEAAILVGGAIEEIDILDLQNNLANLTQPDIRQVYENLLAGSENHLRAFANTYARQTGEAYEPQYMTETAYTAILSQSTQNNAPMQGSAMGGRGKRP